jgi:hypothetical protein
MSDQPLFQDADEEEATFGSTQTTSAETEGTVVVPGAVAAGGVLSGQLGTGIAGMGSATAVGAVAAGINHSPAEDLDSDGVIENEEIRQARS